MKLEILDEYRRPANVVLLERRHGGNNPDFHYSIREIHLYRTEEQARAKFSKITKKEGHT